MNRYATTTWAMLGLKLTPDEKNEILKPIHQFFNSMSQDDPWNPAMIALHESIMDAIDGYLFTQYNVIVEPTDMEPTTVSGVVRPRAHRRFFEAYPVMYKSRHRRGSYGRVETVGAILVQIAGEEKWVARSQIVSYDGRWLTITPWLAKKWAQSA